MTAELTEIENLCCMDHVTAGMTIITDTGHGPGEHLGDLVRLLARDGCGEPRDVISRLVCSGKLRQHRTRGGSVVVLLGKADR